MVSGQVQFFRGGEDKMNAQNEIAASRFVLWTVDGQAGAVGRQMSLSPAVESVETDDEAGNVVVTLAEPLSSLTLEGLEVACENLAAEALGDGLVDAVELATVARLHSAQQASQPTIEAAAQVFAVLVTAIDYDEMSDADDLLHEYTMEHVERYAICFGETEFARACLSALFDAEVCDPVEVLADYFAIPAIAILAEETAR